MFNTPSKIKILLVREDSYPFFETGQSAWAHLFTNKICSVSFVIFSHGFNLENFHEFLSPLYHINKMAIAVEKLNDFLF